MFYCRVGRESRAGLGAAGLRACGGPAWEPVVSSAGLFLVELERNFKYGNDLRADAQVGNWLGWRHHSWEVGGRPVTGEDLMRRTILYKVGHHASHNATREEHGLEQSISARCSKMAASRILAVLEVPRFPARGWRTFSGDHQFQV